MSSTSPPDKANLSQVPSWVLVGFLVGVVTMWFFYRSHRESAVSAEPEASAVSDPAATPAAKAGADQPANPLAVPGKPSLVRVEALFDTFRDWAFWTDHRTEIAVWNSSTASFSDHFEVLRTEDGDFFRSIPGFTRLPLEGYGPPNCPVQFSETVEQRRRRYLLANPDKVPPPGNIVPLEFKQLPVPPAGGG